METNEPVTVGKEISLVKDNSLVPRNGKKLVVPDQDLLDLVRPGKTPAWTKLPSMADALDAFQKNHRSVIVQVNGLALSGDMITPSGSWRCLTVAQALVTGQIPWDATIITTGGKGKGDFEGEVSEGDAFRTEILRYLKEFGEPVSPDRIYVENQARNTFDNAKRCADIVAGLVDDNKRNPSQGIPMPYLLIIASTNWHCDRQTFTNTIIPEASEFSLWYKKFPGIEIRSLKAPYPPWTSHNPQTCWLARAHVATHFFAPLQTNLSAIRDERLSELRAEAVGIYGAALVELSFLEDEIPSIGPRHDFVEAAWSQLSDKEFWKDLCDFYELMKSKIGKVLFRDSGEKYANRLSGLTKAIRYITNPDRR